MNNEKITKADILKDYGFRLQINNGTGYTETGKIQKFECNKEDNILLPLGYNMQSNGEIETPEQRAKRMATNTESQSPTNEDEDMLLPVGVSIEN